MWTRKFLAVGVVSGAVVAGIALAAIWLVLFVANGGGDPSWTLANVSQAGIVGIIAYPVCWYALIYRRRDYSTRRTWFLIGVTYAAASSLVIGFIFVGMFIPATEIILAAVASPKIEGLWVVAGALIAPFIMLMFGVIIAGFIGIAYVATAAPIAFLHRLAMIRLFGR